MAWMMRGLAVLVFLGGTAALVVLLVHEAGSGKAVIEAYVASVRAGAEVSADVGGAEAGALTQTFRHTERLSVGNFQSQANTSCFWVTVHGGQTSTDVQFVLADDAAGPRVAAASAQRGCDCPDPDVDQPCHLE